MGCNSLGSGAFYGVTLPWDEGSFWKLILDRIPAMLPHA